MNKSKLYYFKKDVENYWHCEVRDAESGIDLIRALRNPSHHLSESDFKKLLSETISMKSLNPNEYEKITGLDMESRDDVASDLQDLWNIVFPKNI